jgi:hypothetical protein
LIHNLLTEQFTRQVHSVLYSLQHKYIARKNDMVFLLKNPTYCMHCTANPIYVFLEMKLQGLVPNSWIHESVRDL